MELIDDVLFFDDSSSPEEKQQMEVLVRELFVGKSIHVTHFVQSSFSDSFRHPRILNVVRDKLIDTSSGYFYMLEDDYLMVDFFDLLPGLDLLSQVSSCAYVSYYQAMKKFPDDQQPDILNYRNMDFWRWPYRPDLPLNCNLFYDDVGSVQTLVPGFWITMINWPSFSLRPGIHDTVKFLSIGEFSTDYDTNSTKFELEFALRWVKKWDAWCQSKFHVVNLGWDQSNNAYALNGSEK